MRKTTAGQDRWDGPWQEWLEVGASAVFAGAYGIVAPIVAPSATELRVLLLTGALSTVAWAVASMWGRWGGRPRVTLGKLVVGSALTAWAALYAGRLVTFPRHGVVVDHEAGWSLAIVAVVSSLLLGWMDLRDHDERFVPQQVQAQPEVAVVESAVLGCKGARLVERRTWQNGNGYDLVIDLPEDGRATLRDFQNAAKDILPKQFRLPAGCGVDVVEGEHRAQVVVRVQNRDGMAAPRRYSIASVDSPPSISGSTPLGWDRLGDMVSVDFFPHHGAQRAFLWGNTGSGKSNTLNVLIAGWARSQDALVWVIDPSTKAGADFRDWVDPYLDGSVAHPGIDWLAIGEVQAIRVLDSALAICAMRLRHHRVRKITPSQTTPALVVLMDEAATFLGPQGSKEVSDRWLRLIKESRAAGFVVVTACLRAVASEFSDQNVKVQAAVRIGLRVTQQSEAAWGFDNAPVDVRTMRHVGMGASMQQGDYPLGFRTWDLDGGVSNVVSSVQTVRPVLEPACVQAAGQAYADRWEHTRRALDGEVEAVQAASQPAVQPTTSRASSLLAAAEEATAPASGWLDGIDPASLADLERVEVEADPSILDAILRCIPEGRAGIPTDDLLGLIGRAYPGMDRKGLAAALRQFGVEPQQFKLDGVPVRGYRRDQVVEARERRR